MVHTKHLHDAPCRWCPCTYWCCKDAMFNNQYNIRICLLCFHQWNAHPTINYCVAITTFGGKKEFGILAANVLLDKTLSMINFLLSNPWQVHNSLSMISIILEAILLWSRFLKIFSPTVSAKIISSWHKTIFLVACDLHVLSNLCCFPWPLLI